MTTNQKVAGSNPSGRTKAYDYRESFHLNAFPVVIESSGYILMTDENFRVDDLRLTFDTHRILRNAKIITVKDILDREHENSLYKVRNLGRKHYEEIKKALLEVGIELV